MGQTLRTLSAKPLKKSTVFNNRFVIELCEAVHVHYRNLRVLQSWSDFERMARGFVDALNRWEKRGKPEPMANNHIELCRHVVAQDSQEDMVRINLNKNLYQHHEGRIFAEGSGITDPEYIHVKIRELRLEMPIDEFETIADAFAEAKVRLNEGKQDSGA